MGWLFMFDNRPRVTHPLLARTPVTRLAALLLAAAAVLLLFFVKWYAGLIGIAGHVLGANIFAVIGNAIYRAAGGRGKSSV